MHTCWVQEKSYKPACRQIFQDAAEEILNATYQPDSKRCAILVDLHMRLSTEFPMLMPIFIAFLLKLEWIVFISYLFPNLTHTIRCRTIFELRELG